MQTVTLGFRVKASAFQSEGLESIPVWVWGSEPRGAGHELSSSTPSVLPPAPAPIWNLTQACRNTNGVCKNARCVYV